VKCRALRRLRDQLGQRGPFLVFMGVGKVCFGAGMIVEPPALEGLGLLTRFAPLHCWALVWIAAGAAAFTCAWLRFGRDRYGFLAASVPPSLWAFAYLWGAVIGDYARGLWIFLWYITSHCGVIWCASRVAPMVWRNRPGAEGRPG
jgi:hypothetical protein